MKLRRTGFDLRNLTTRHALFVGNWLVEMILFYTITDIRIHEEVMQLCSYKNDEEED